MEYVVMTTGHREANIILNIVSKLGSVVPCYRMNHKIGRLYKFNCQFIIALYWGVEPSAIRWLSRTTPSCRQKALLSSSGPDSIEKKTLDRQARLHTVGFSLAENRRPDGRPMWGVWLKASLLYGTQVTRVRIDGGVV